MTTQSMQFRNPSLIIGFTDVIVRFFTGAGESLNRFLLPREPEAVESVAKLRELAASYADSQPSFAADLLAAADRYDAKNQ